MNITPNAPTLSVPTAVNLPTESLRRENNQREMIAQPAALSQSAAEKGVGSEKDKGKTPAQNNEKIDFVSLEKQAEQENSTISEQNEKNEQNQKNDESSPESQQRPSYIDEQASFQEEQIVSELKSRDREVRSHELAHSAVGGAATGAPSYTFETGPDGKKYAVEGAVSVDLSKVKDNPRATIAKMQKVHAAALAPAQPSVQDNRVASSAAKIILQQQSKLLAEQSESLIQAKADPRYISPNTSFDQQVKHSENDDFDTFINQTLEAQDEIAPTRSEDVNERAERIETFYLNINRAYEKPPSFQFELTA